MEILGYTAIMKHAPAPHERPIDALLWLITHMGGWLHLVTLALLSGQWTGFFNVRGWIVFLPSLVLAAFIVLLMGAGYSLNIVCRWINTSEISEQPVASPVFLEQQRAA